MAVIGGGGERHLGKYRLALTCENDACIDTNPIDLDPDCDERVFSLVDECDDLHLSEVDFDFDDPAEEISIDFCVDDGGAIESLEFFGCDGAADDSELCRVSTADLQTNVDSCRQPILDLYNVVETASLGRFLGQPQFITDIQEELEADFDSIS